MLTDRIFARRAEFWEQEEAEETESMVDRTPSDFSATFASSCSKVFDDGHRPRYGIPNRVLRRCSNNPKLATANMTQSVRTTRSCLKADGIVALEEVEASNELETGVGAWLGGSLVLPRLGTLNVNHYQATGCVASSPAGRLPLVRRSARTSRAIRIYYLLASLNRAAPHVTDCWRAARRRAID